MDTNKEIAELHEDIGQLQEELSYTSSVMFQKHKEIEHLVNEMAELDHRYESICEQLRDAEDRLEVLTNVN